MIEIANMILNWLHLVATVVWLGGIAFILFILITKAKEVMGQDAGKLIGAASKRYKSFADWCIVILIITGIGLYVINMPSNQKEDAESPWMLLLIIKHVIVLMMVLIHLYRNHVLAKKIINEQNPVNKIALQKYSLNMVKIVFIFGLIVIMLSLGSSI